jgi:hypothetical protein
LDDKWSVLLGPSFNKKAPRLIKVLSLQHNVNSSPRKQIVEGEEVLGSPGCGLSALL